MCVRVCDGGSVCLKVLFIKREGFLKESEDILDSKSILSSPHFYSKDCLRVLSCFKGFKNVLTFRANSHY